MPQFDVVENANPETSGHMPYLLILQADLFDGLATRVVAPLIPLEMSGPALDRLNPVISIEDDSYVVSIAELAGVPVQALGDHVASVTGSRLEVISALDFLFTGS
jgi:toxin CcdB